MFTMLNAEFDRSTADIAVVNAHGSRREQLTNRVGFDVSAAWSPDGRRIAFTSERARTGDPGEQPNDSELFVMNADGSQVRRITNTLGVTDFNPAWSPDGRHIVVARADGTPPPPGQLTQPSDLVIVHVATGRERRLTNSPSTWEGWPHWSPDGSRIAFTGDLLDPGNDDIYTIRVNGTGLRRLTTAPGFELGPRWTPDGKRVVFDADNNDGYDIYWMRPDGSDVRQLTTDHISFSAAPSPDGRYLAMVKDSGTATDIFRMRLDGTQLKNLTRTPTEFEIDPEWQPR